MFYEELTTNRGVCMTDSASGQESVRQMSDRDIERTFNELIEWWEQSEDARYELEQFKRDNPEPTPPASLFGGVQELALYNQRRWQFEQGVEDRSARRHERMSRFEAVADRVKLLLPVGHTLAHTYSGDNPSLQGAGYNINHFYGPRRGDPSEVSVEKTRPPRPQTR